MKKPLVETILIVDDHPANLDVLTQTLEPVGFHVLAVPNGEIALRVAERAKPDLIMLDVVMPEFNGFDVCEMLKKNPATRDIPVIFLSARNETRTLVKGFQAGGVDYITKPFQAEEVLARIETHLKNRRLTAALKQKNRQLIEQADALKQTNEKLAAEIKLRTKAEEQLQVADQKLDVIGAREAEHWNVSGLIGQSPSMARILEDVDKLKSFGNTTVLILGESGTGKELLARAIHSRGPHAKGPFIPVNCVAIPAELAESMLFGHIRGSFTGAIEDRKGYFELAHQGTLFLDEIGDMPLPLQAKLLRVLEDGMVYPIGSSKGKKITCRVVAATNAQLETHIANGTFRQDLYFRLARFTVTPPPLRERTEDIPALARHFIDLFVKEMGRKAPPLTTSALARLKTHPYPGNIRELKNIIERALIRSGGDAISPEHLDLPGNSTISSLPHPKPPQLALTPDSSLPLNLEEAETLLIRRALNQTQGNIAQAARLLGIHRTRIYRMMASKDA
ncbi:sigma-54-dependent Fis family transcriptional regulator [Phragmitibacter flavus]|uniref:Sigma-54-dependent Fis family transcriptional regulator n=1 Tax=Phragmitibacter flavus TaxID=2576071 RepID=A0A5R8KCG5_9BACT|nr:sigma-54 dependent transcriptional regulator [Phragmitibacter flavus]TLD69996.1 sigma-54-dependent Fis family transcriptional regulator [Phragmitibacter flavus]